MRALRLGGTILHQIVLKKREKKFFVKPLISKAVKSEVERSTTQKGKIPFSFLCLLLLTILIPKIKSMTFSKYIRTVALLIFEIFS